MISVKCSTNMALPLCFTKCFTVAASSAMPSMGVVPLPNSSSRHNDRSVCEESILLVWVRSSAKEDCDEDTLVGVKFGLVSYISF